MTPPPYDKIRDRVDTSMPPEAILAACDSLRNGHSLTDNLANRGMKDYITGAQVDALKDAMERIR